MNPSGVAGGPTVEVVAEATGGERFVKSTVMSAATSTNTATIRRLLAHADL
jgi:hypothetical protein